MAILVINCRNILKVRPRSKGSKGERDPKVKPQVRDGATLGSSRRDGHGGFLDFWLKPLVASGYDYEATERKTGVTVREMRRVVALMRRMEVEAETLCSASTKAKLVERNRARAGTPSAQHKPKRTATGKDWFVTAAEIEAVHKLHVVAGFLQRETAERLGITKMRVQVICRAARRRNLWPSSGKGVAS